MKQLNENPVPSRSQRLPAEPMDQGHPSGAKILSDRHAVIAIMFANGLTCEEIGDRLSLALDSVHTYLEDTLEILNIFDIDDLTYAVIASHYNHESPHRRDLPSFNEG